MRNPECFKLRLGVSQLKVYDDLVPTKTESHQIVIDFGASTGRLER